MKPLTEEEIKDIPEIVEQEVTLATSTDLGIIGLEDIPVSMLPVPFVRLIQPSSRDTEIASGQEAVPGSYFFNDTKETTTDLKFALLKAKHGEMTFKRDEQITTSLRVAILGVRLDNFKPFTMTLSVMSFNNFGAMVSQLKAKGVKASYEYAITATSEKQENKKGKYYVAKFSLGDKLDEETITKLQQLSIQYESSLDRKSDNTEDVF